MKAKIKHNHKQCHTKMFNKEKLSEQFNIKMQKLGLPMCFEKKKVPLETKIFL